MEGIVCTLSESGRHSLSVVATNLSLLIAYLGDMLVMVALYIKFVLESRVAVAIGSHAGALAYFLLAVGLVLCIVCAASAKATYDAGCREMATRRTCRILLFTMGCQGLALALVLAAVIMCLVHRSLLRDALHNGFLAAIKIYGMNDKVKAGVNRIQSRFQCCGARSMHDWFRIPWVPMAYLDVDHPDVARRIVDGDFLTDDAPYSCCDVHASRPCVHHQVQNMSAHQLLGPGGTLYRTGCGDRLEHYWKSTVLHPMLGLLLVVALLLVVSMTLSRLLQTSLEGALDKGDPAGRGDAYCCKGLPCLPRPQTTTTTVHVHHDHLANHDRRGSGGDSGDRQGWRRPDASQNKSSNRKPCGQDPARAPQGGTGDSRQPAITHCQEYSGDRQGPRTTTAHAHLPGGRDRHCSLNTTTNYSTAGHLRNTTMTRGRRDHSLDRIWDGRQDPKQIGDCRGYRQGGAWRMKVQSRDKGKKGRDVVKMEDERKVKRKVMKARRRMETLGPNGMTRL